MTATDSSFPVARPDPGRDVRFCPVCGEMSFDVLDVREDSVYCEFCGVHVSCADLVKTP